MAVLKYQLEKKSLDQMLIDAACCKWDVDESFFRCYTNRKGGKDKNTDKRRILHWLLWKDCNMTFADIAERFGYTKQSMQEGIEKIDFMMSVYLSIAHDVASIREIAGKLQVNMEISVVDISVKIK